jgi:hypothetical protein
VTVLAWIFIVPSGFVTVMSILQNIFIQTIFRHPEFHQAAQTLPPDAPPSDIFMSSHIQTFVFALPLVLLLVSAFMLMSSIGLLRRWNWARLCFIGLMMLSIIWQLVGLGIQFFMFSSMRAHLSAASTQGGPNINSFFNVLSVVTALFALGVSVLFGWIVKKLMSAPIRAEFQR